MGLVNNVFIPADGGGQASTIGGATAVS